MAKFLVIAEKPSVAQSLAKNLSAYQRKDGYLEGNSCIVSWGLGHLAEYAPPEIYNEKYAKWQFEDLPIIPEVWKVQVSEDKKKQFDVLCGLMNRADVAYLVNGCDAGREGELIFKRVYDLAGCQKPVKRLWISSMEEEYDNLKHFTLINECKKCIHMLSDNNMLDKDKYYTSVHLNHCMLLFMNRLARMFKFIEVQIEAENKWIKTHLDDIYYNEVYLFSDEYVEQWAERAEAEAEYYAEHPEAFEDMEESEEDRLFEKINEAIWAGDVETIKKCFPQIDKNDKQIQAELTWIVAKDVMKNRELRELYFQKYGVKYKVRKEKRRNS